MKWTGLNDLRESYLSFFESKGHLRLNSFPLVPQGDNSILLINAGMTPLKKYFQGIEEPPRHRVTTCQKCIRTPDIENVGKTARHGTYFEMLGNFSFGDYFKHEAIAWAWEYLTKVLEIPPERLWVTIYEQDDEAGDIWANEVGVPRERIIKLGKADNFWEHGSGPCGPCSENTTTAARSTVTSTTSVRTTSRKSATATVSSRSGTTYSPSSTTTATATTPSSRPRTSTPAWVWSVSHA